MQEAELSDEATEVMMGNMTSDPSMSEHQKHMARAMRNVYKFKQWIVDTPFGLMTVPIPDA